MKSKRRKIPLSDEINKTKTLNSSLESDLNNVNVTVETIQTQIISEIDMLLTERDKLKDELADV